MNADQWLLKVADLLDELRPVGAGSFRVYVYKKAVGVRRRKDVPIGSHAIAQLTSRDINDGLTSRGWDKIQGELVDLVTRGLL